VGGQLSCPAHLESWAGAPRWGVHLLSDRIKTVSKAHLNEPLGCPSSEEQIPQVIGKTEKTRTGMEGLEGNFTRPRQVRYQAALRPDI